MDPITRLEQALADATRRIGETDTIEALESLDAQVLGKGSDVAEVRRQISAFDVETRPRVGAVLNRVTAALEELLEERRHTLSEMAETRQLATEGMDVTLEAVSLPLGSLHLIQQTIDEVVDIFVGMGYQLAAGPEAELAWYNFDALNTPPTHPARLESDTMYLEWGEAADEVLLRTQTSPVQARWMETHDPPVYVVVPGKCYRTDTVDATHLPVFHQIEGLAVDSNIVFSDLKGTLLHFAREYFGPSTTVGCDPTSSPSPSPAPSSTSHVSPVTGASPGVGCAQARGSSRCSAAAWWTPMCSKPSATTRGKSPGSPSVSGSNDWRWCGMASTP
jgi:phenylalanyl-tRNA synthetase alpha chain